MKSVTLTLRNKLGLHARASAKFVIAASRYTCHIEVRHKDKTVDGKSIMGMMTLAASKGAELTLVADGIDEVAALETLSQLIERKFLEE